MDMHMSNMYMCMYVVDMWTCEQGRGHGRGMGHGMSLGHGQDGFCDKFARAPTKFWCICLEEEGAGSLRSSAAEPAQRLRLHRLEVFEQLRPRVESPRLVEGEHLPRRSQACRLAEYPTFLDGDLFITVGHGVVAETACLSLLAIAHSLERAYLGRLFWRGPRDLVAPRRGATSTGVERCLRLERREGAIC